MVTKRWFWHCKMKGVFWILLLGAAQARAGDGKQHSKQKSENVEQNGHNLRSRELIEKTLKYDGSNMTLLHTLLDELVKIYETTISPLETAYQYNDISVKGEMTVQEIKAQPMVLFLGPWSTGKTTMINYLLDTDILRVGAEPTTDEFTVVDYGEKEKNIEGVTLVSGRKEYAALEKFGHNFMARLSGVEVPHPLLKKVTLVDTPPIVETRAKRERGYPFNEVVQWFIEKADLIFVVFDHTKLDVGLELESLFKLLKGKESKLRLILNKADMFTPQDLMRVYGALLWSLAPLIHVPESPRIYTGSFWPNEYKPSTNTDLYKHDEKELLQDFNNVIDKRVVSKIASVWQHAKRVRIHSLLVNEYLTAYKSRKSFFEPSDPIVKDLLRDPENFDIFKTVSSRPGVSQFDLPPPSLYSEFFLRNYLLDFKLLKQYCSYLIGCEIDKLETSISKTLPELQEKASKQSSNESTSDVSHDRVEL